MKEFFEKLMSDDENDRRFTREEIVVYGVMVPLGLFALMVLAGWIEMLCQ